MFPLQRFNEISQIDEIKLSSAFFKITFTIFGGATLRNSSSGKCLLTFDDILEMKLTALKTHIL